MTVEFRNNIFNLPYRGRFGCNIAYTLSRIMSSSNGIALYSAMSLSGRAKKYEARYRAAFIRFAEANTDVLVPGHWGPKGGWGYRFNAAPAPLVIPPLSVQPAEQGEQKCRTNLTHL